MPIRWHDEEETAPAQPPRAAPMPMSEFSEAESTLAPMSEFPEAESTLAPTRRIRWHTPTQERETSALGYASNIANEINYGALQMFGLQGIGAKLYGIGVNRPEGEDGKPTPMQGGLRMLGMGASTTALAMIPGANQARAALNYGAQSANAIRSGAGLVAPMDVALSASQTGVKAGIEPAVMKFLNQTAETAVRNPKLFFGSEALSSFVAGAAGQDVYNRTEDPHARVGAELVGGVIGGMIPLVTKIADFSPVLQMGRSMVRNIMAGENKTLLGRNEAARRMQGVAEDVPTAMREAGSVDVLPGLSYAARSGDQGLLSLEKAVYESSEKLSERGRQKFAEINAASRQALIDLEPGQGSPDQARLYLQELMEDRVNIAGIAAEERLAALAPGTNRETANIYARQELNDAYTPATTLEGQLWDAVPDELVGTASTTQASYREILDRNRADPVLAVRAATDIPKDIQSLLGGYDKAGVFQLGKLGEAPTMGSLKNLRSELMTEARKERSEKAPNRRKIGVLERLSNDILSDMRAMAPGDESLDLARAYSYDLNKRFRQGTVGEILGFERTGEGRVAEIMTIERAIGRPGVAGAQAVDELLAGVERTGNVAAMRGNIESVLVDEFLRRSREGGEFSPTSARRWMTRRADVLQRFPELGRSIQRAIVAGDESVAALRMRDPAMAMADMVLRRPAGTEIKAIIGAPRSNVAAREVVGLLSTNPEAAAGFRKSFAQYILDEATEPSRLDVRDAPVLSGPRLSEILNDRSVAQAMREVFSPEQMARFQTVLNTTLRTHRQQRATTTQAALAANENFLSKAMRRVAGAAAGRKFGKAIGSGATVQIPGIFSRLTDELAERGLDPARMVVVEAITSGDDTLIKALLTEPITATQTKRMAGRLNAWAYTTAYQYGIDLSKPESQERIDERNRQLLYRLDSQGKPQ